MDTSNVGTCWNLSTSRCRFGTTKVKLSCDMCFSQRAHPVDSSKGLDDCQMVISYDFITLCASEIFLGEIQFPATTSHKSIQISPWVVLTGLTENAVTGGHEDQGLPKRTAGHLTSLLTRSVLKRRMWV